MGRFLAIFNGAADANDPPVLTDEQQAEFMDAWGAWARTNRTNLVDPGAPLYRKRRISAGGVEDLIDSRVAYSIVEAGSHDEAVGIFGTHPHLTLLNGNSIDVLECPEIPSRSQPSARLGDGPV